MIRETLVKNLFYICAPYGALAEWLGRGLQNLVRRFESARRLNKKPLFDLGVFYLLKYLCYSDDAATAFISSVNEAESLNKDELATFPSSPQK